MHVHIETPEGEAKFWLEPVVALANHSGLTAKVLKDLQDLVEVHNREITQAWKKHFKK